MSLDEKLDISDFIKLVYALSKDFQAPLNAFLDRLEEKE